MEHDIDLVSFLGWPEFFYIFNIQLTLRFKKKKHFLVQLYSKSMLLQFASSARAEETRCTLLNCFKIVQIQYTCKYFSRQQFATFENQ